MEDAFLNPIKAGVLVRSTYLFDNSKERVGLVLGAHSEIGDNIIFWFVLWDDTEEIGIVSEYEVEVLDDSSSSYNL